MSLEIYSLSKQSTHTIHSVSFTSNIKQDAYSTYQIAWNTDNFILCTAKPHEYQKPSIFKVFFSPFRLPDFPFLPLSVFISVRK